MSRKKLLAIAGAAVLALSACAGSDSETTAEGDPLVIYSGRSEELVGPILEQFSQETGIPIEVRYGDTSGMASQLLVEGEATPADVFLAQDAGALGAVSQEGLFAAMPTELTEVVPTQYRAVDNTWTAVTGRARVFVYNPDLVPADQVPTTVFDLTDPKWKGQVAIAPANASFQSFVTAMRVTDGDAATEEWLAGMAANDAQIYEKNGLILDAVDAGQAAIGLINHYYWFEKAAEVGTDAMVAQLSYTEAGDPGSLVNISGVGILQGAADNPNAAALVEFLLGDTAQTYFTEETFEYPMNPAVPPAADLVPLDELQPPELDLADLSTLPVTVEMIQQAGLL